MVTFLTFFVTLTPSRNICVWPWMAFSLRVLIVNFRTNMWKYVSRRIRDTFERSANHFDRRSTTGVVNSTSNVTDDKNKRAGPPCCWFRSRKCWGASRENNNTNDKKWNFEELNRSWIGAITWSGGLVIGWYTSQILHLKLKYYTKEKCRNTQLKNRLLSSLYPYVTSVNQNPVYLKSVSQIEKVLGRFTPTVHLISNEQNGEIPRQNSAGSSGTTSTTNTDSSNDLGDVLNSIENKLGLAAIENGQLQDGINLLRSAALRNHAPALYNLGLCYELGLGVTIDEKTAMELYRSAAALEHPGALYNLGIFYGQGRGGLLRDTKMATRLLRLAAVQGQQNAIDALKSLNLDTTDTSEENEIPLYFNCTPYSHNIVPSPTTLFVENVNYLLTQNNEATIY